MMLVDTSVWIDFLAGKSTLQVQVLEESLKSSVVCIDQVIFTEVCVGARGSEQYQKYANYFSALRQLYLPSQWGPIVADKRFFLKTKGITTFLADAIIAEVALTHAIPLLTADKGFASWQKYFSLRLL